MLFLKTNINVISVKVENELLNWLNEMEGVGGNQSSHFDSFLYNEM